MTDRDDKPKLTRRELLRRGLQAGGVVVLAGGTAGLISEAVAGKGDTVWQLDPDKCVKCGNCATRCVLDPSAVKAVHAYEICGYCELCTGYFDPKATELTTAAENQLCPTGAIVRTFKKDPYYEYSIDEELCIGCGKCVDGCERFGNGSLFLQVRHDRCVNCNKCTIAPACPADAFRRVPADQPYLLKTR